MPKSCTIRSWSWTFQPQNHVTSTISMLIPYTKFKHFGIVFELSSASFLSYAPNTTVKNTLIDPATFTFQFQNHITSMISQGHSPYQVWTVWDRSFLSYAGCRQTEDTECLPTPTNIVAWAIRAVKLERLCHTCRVPSQQGDSGPWMLPGEHSTPVPGWRHYAYTGRTCGTTGTSASGGHQPWSDCRPRARGSEKADSYPTMPTMQAINQHLY